jgi:gas vesicle protein
MDDRMSYASMMVGFLVGGVAGAAAALLLAPQSGRATRERMAFRLGRTADSVRAMRDRVLAKSGEMADDAAHRVSGAASALAGGDRLERGPTREKSPST